VNDATQATAATNAALDATRTTLDLEKVGRAYAEQQLVDLQENKQRLQVNAFSSC
jgi:hypothetical protein